MLRRLGLLGVALLIAFSLVPRSHAQTKVLVDNSTLTGKLIMGYQGWFSCPNAATHRGWVHWKAGDAITVDMLPDTTELSPEEKCNSGLTSAAGKPVYFYDSGNPKTVDRHFGWMEQYGIPGVALQKFQSQLLHPETQARSDLILQNVKQSAENHGRVFFLMYDLSGATDDRLDGIVADWIRLNNTGRVDGPAYLHHHGHKVVGLWGIGFAGRALTPDGIIMFLAKLRQGSSSFGGVTIVAGVPSYWRLGMVDASNDPGWKNVWPKIDVISPWTVGRYNDDASADDYRKKFLEPDLAATRSMGVDYMPVIFPGFSWANLMRAHHDDQHAIRNQIPRRCGAFYWHQAGGALLSGANMLYNAMFDEVDEGTAMFNLTPSASDAPRDPSFVTLDIDGCELPSNWYLKLAGAVSDAIRKRTELPQAVPSLK
jgi:hypothetical protein